MADRITAMDIENQDFPRRLRGYSEEDVQLFLKSIAGEVQRLNLENAERMEETGMLRRQLEEFQKRERNLQDALISAKQLSDEMVERSRAEAELMVKEARIKAERLLQQSQDQLARIEDEIGRAKLERDAFEKNLKGTVEHHLELLDLRRRERQQQENLHVFRRATGQGSG